MIEKKRKKHIVVSLHFAAGDLCWKEVIAM
jgi:hypothetical protein